MNSSISVPRHLVPESAADYPRCPICGASNQDGRNNIIFDMDQFLYICRAQGRYHYFTLQNQAAESGMYHLGASFYRYFLSEKEKVLYDRLSEKIQYMDFTVSQLGRANYYLRTDGATKLSDVHRKRILNSLHEIAVNPVYIGRPSLVNQPYWLGLQSMIPDRSYIERSISKLAYEREMVRERFKNLSDREKIRRVYDYITNQGIKYMKDDDAILHGYKSPHCLATLINDKVGVCQSIALYAAVLYRGIGIWAAPFVVKLPDNNHMILAVKHNNNVFFCDPTSDNGKNRPPQFFMMNRKKLNRNIPSIIRPFPLPFPGEAECCAVSNLVR